MRHLTRVQAVAAAGAASLLAIGAVTAASAAATSSPPPGSARVNVPGTHLALATPKALQRSAPALPSRITANLYLAARTGLTAYAQAVSTPGSALYGHYLTAAQAQRLFAPTAAEAQQVKAWAASNGLSVGTETSGFGAYVQVTGSPSAVAHAFGVSFGSYHVKSKKSSESFWAAEQSASLPGSVASDVLTVSGLDSTTHLMKPGDTLPPPPQNYVVAPYCSTYYGQKTATTVADTNPAVSVPTVNGTAQPWTNCGYTPDQIRGAYNVAKSGETGKGVTVAVIDAYASPTMLADANSYAKWAAAQPGGNATLDKPFRSGQYTEVLHPGATGYDDTAASQCGASGWYGEESLDVESVHGMAPDANVVYVGASDCTDAGLGNALAYVVNHRSASIVTDSWGEPTDGSSLTALYDTLFEAGATEGVGFFFSAGDSGYEDPNFEGASDMVQADYPSSSPWVTSVGGTSLAIGKANNYEFETGWGTVTDPLTTTSTGASAWSYPPQANLGTNDPLDAAFNYDGSSGGGVSTVYTQPWYQRGVVPTSLATTEVVSTPYTVSTSSGPVELFNESTTTAKTAMRVTPDVAALADPSTGTAVGETLYGPDNSAGKPAPLKFRISRIGGTSVASPVFAGIEADAQQAYGRAIGFANPAIYLLDAANSATRAFHDVTDTPGNAQQYEVRSNYTDPYNQTLPLLTYLRFEGQNGVDGTITFPFQTSSTTTVNLTVTLDSILHATAGYDDETGVGSPNNYINAYKLFNR